MKFKCLISGCIYDFNEPLDIKSMQASQDYEVVPDEPVKVLVASATVVPAAPVKLTPAKPVPVVSTTPTAV